MFNLNFSFKLFFLILLPLIANSSSNGSIEYNISDDLTNAGIIKSLQRIILDYADCEYGKEPDAVEIINMFPKVAEENLFSYKLEREFSSGKLKILDSKTKAIIKEFYFPWRFFYDIQISDCPALGRKIIVVSMNVSGVKLFDFETGDFLKSVEIDSFGKLRALPNGLMAGLSYEFTDKSKIIIFDPNTGKKINTINYPDINSFEVFKNGDIHFYTLNHETWTKYEVVYKNWLNKTKV